MSAVFIVKYRGQPVKFHGLAGVRTRWEVTTLSRATPFTSEAEAWIAINDYELGAMVAEVVAKDPQATSHPAGRSGARSALASGGMEGGAPRL